MEMSKLLSSVGKALIGMEIGDMCFGGACSPGTAFIIPCASIHSHIILPPIIKGVLPCGYATQFRLTFSGPIPEQRTMIQKIISGGQTGADRAALDVALKFGISSQTAMVNLSLQSL
jgi:hypothetical protein